MHPVQCLHAYIYTSGYPELWIAIYVHISRQLLTWGLRYGAPSEGAKRAAPSTLLLLRIKTRPLLLFLLLVLLPPTRTRTLYIRTSPWVYCPMLRAQKRHVHRLQYCNWHYYCDYYYYYCYYFYYCLYYFNHRGENELYILEPHLGSAIRCSERKSETCIAFNMLISTTTTTPTTTTTTITTASAYITSTTDTNTNSIY